MKRFDRCVWPCLSDIVSQHLSCGRGIQRPLGSGFKTRKLLPDFEHLLKLATRGVEGLISLGETRDSTAYRMWFTVILVPWNLQARYCSVVS